jgi:hypothetical protein
MAARSKLATALERGLAPGGDLDAELEQRGEQPLDRADARALCAALAGVNAASLRAGAQEGAFAGRLHTLTALFQEADDEAVAVLLAREGLPHLLRLYDEERALPDGGNEHTLLLLLKVFAWYQSRPGLDRIAAAARDARLAEGLMWPVILGTFDAEHPLRHELIDRLRDPLPIGSAALAYLDCVNALAIAGELQRHPFDTPAGKALLRRWLTSSDEGERGCAVSATAALPFLSPPQRDELLALAMDHTSAKVQVEAG